MRKLNQAGSLLVPFVLVLVLMLGSLGFGIWAFAGRQDFKNNSDKKAAAAVKLAVATEDTKKDAAFAEAEKSPFKTYNGPETFGSIVIQYPKTWSSYVLETGRSGNLAIDGYFSPNYVPDIQSDVLFALRIQVVSTDYATALKTYDSTVKSGKVSVSAYRPPKVSNALGSILTGALTSKIQGTMVLLPLRDKTIEIWTEGTEFTNDFNNTILPSLTFIP